MSKEFQKANMDIRIKCMENGVKLWQVAEALDVSPETVTRKLRRKLNTNDKYRFINAIETIISERG